MRSVAGSSNASNGASSSIVVASTSIAVGVLGLPCRLLVLLPRSAAASCAGERRFRDISHLTICEEGHTEADSAKANARRRAQRLGWMQERQRSGRRAGHRAEAGMHVAAHALGSVGPERHVGKSTAIEEGGWREGCSTRPGLTRTERAARAAAERGQRGACFSNKTGHAV